MLKSLSHHEEDEELKVLENVLKSSTFKKAKHVSSYLFLFSGGHVL